MDLEKKLPKPWRRTRWFWAIVIVVAIIIIVAIVVPLAVILPKNHSKIPRGSVIVPLYLYPLNDSSWSPLYDA